MTDFWLSGTGVMPTGSEKDSFTPSFGIIPDGTTALASIKLFVIAEKDLELRGPGEVMGTRQTGAISFRIADLARDADLLDTVHEIAEDIFTNSPQVIQPLCDRWLGASTDYAEV